MRVLFVNPGRALGGAEHSLLLLLQGFRTRGVDASVSARGRFATVSWPSGSPLRTWGCHGGPGPPGVTDLLAGRLEGLRW